VPPFTTGVLSTVIEDLRPKAGCPHDLFEL
jgi:hypothetical protein